MTSKQDHHGRPSVLSTWRERLAGLAASDKADVLLDIARNAAGLLVRLRDRPRGLDWLAVGVGAATAGAKAYRAFHQTNEIGSYFTHDLGVEWAPFAVAFRGIVTRHAVHERTVTNGGATRFGCDYSCVVADLGGEEVGWVRRNKKRSAIAGPFYRPARECETFAAFREAMWRDVGTEHAVFQRKGLVDDVIETGELVDTPLLHSLRARVSQFHTNGDRRSYLLEGPPGSGKTTAAKAIVLGLGLRSIRVELDELASQKNHLFIDFGDYEFDELGLETLVRIAEPEAILIDDLDRLALDEHDRLLSTIERLHDATRLLLVTSNGGPMPRALLRPGRLDDHVAVGGLGEATIRTLLQDDDPDIAPELVDWPIAFVLDYRTRVRALGRGAARAELPELSKRVSKNTVPDGPAFVPPSNGKTQNAAMPVRPW